MDLNVAKSKGKEDIRRAAEELFSRFGADKVSVNDIARKAGVSQATIYNNFGSKDELVHDYRKSIVNGIAGRFREILIWKKSFIEKFEGLLQSWIDVSDHYRIEIESADNKQSPDTIGLEIENSLREFIKRRQRARQSPCRSLRRGNHCLYQVFPAGNLK